MTQVFEMKAGNGEVISAQGINISETGLLCRTEVEMIPGEKVLFSITIPGSRSDITVDCEGVIFKCNGSDSGYDVVIDLTDRDCI